LADNPDKVSGDQNSGIGEIVFNRIAGTRQTWFYFIGVLTFYPLFLLAKMPNWILSGNFWDEAATNYYYKAQYEPWYLSLVATDAGYIPLPQRLVALFASFVKIPPEAVPGFYTAVAIAVPALLVGTFTLGFYRSVLESDFFRFVVAITVLLVSDFMTRGFVNFTYFSALFVTAVAVAVMRQPSVTVPIWVWILPVFFISKPAILVLLPLVVLAAVKSRAQFRIIAILSGALSIIQIIRMAGSLKSGTATAFSGDAMSPIEKLLSAGLHGFGEIGGYLVGPKWNLGPNGDVYLGVAVCVLALYWLLWKRSPYAVLAITGIYVVFANAFMHTFTMPIEWQLNLERLRTLSQDRHTIVGFIGFLLFISALVMLLASMLPRKVPVFLRDRFAPFAFICWFVFSGWLGASLSLATVPGLPMTGIGKWQEDAAFVARSPETSCVPIDPLGIVYGQNCMSLAPAYNSLTPVTFDQPPTFTLELTIPDAVKGTSLDSFGVILSPAAGGTAVVTASGSSVAGISGEKYFAGSQTISSSGEMIQVFAVGGRQRVDFTRITLRFSMPVRVGATGAGQVPVVLWMGQP
jgi:hypothetical protein